MKKRTALLEAYDRARDQLDLAKVRWEDARARLAVAEQAYEAAVDAHHDAIGSVLAADLDHKHDRDMLAAIAVELAPVLGSDARRQDVKPGEWYELRDGDRRVRLVVGEDLRLHEAGARA